MRSPNRRTTQINKYQVSDPLVKHILDRFDYQKECWREIREAAKEDMRYVAGDPWDPKEKRARQAVNRPCLTLDELGQYLNALINDVRQNKRAVQVTPKGAGASDKTAEFRGNLIRAIEYASNAQTAYITAAENAFSRSYGYWQIGTQYVADKSFDQEITIKRIQNPDTIYLDYDAKEADFSDAKELYQVEMMRIKDFKDEFPGAKITDFTTEMQESAPAWIKAEEVQICHYWKVELTPRKLYLVKTPNGPISMWADEITEGFNKSLIIKERESKKREVFKYITNGVEILEKERWAGKYIPIIPVLGKEMWVDDGNGSKRMLMSLIRLARDPYMLYCYYRTTEAELVSMTPKTPYMGVEGQFDGHESEWQQVNTNPTAYLQYKAKTVDTGDSVLPAPTRPPYLPQIEPLEMGAESARRAIQAAIGINPLPTAAQRMNEKSGVAIERIKSQADQGSFHFIDNYDRALQYSGRVIDDLIDKIYDTSREVPIRKQNEEHALITINDPQQAEEGAFTGQGDHGVTISVGPSFDSEREEASNFVDTLIDALPNLPIDPTAKPKLLAMAIKLKDIGPLGREMSDIISPPMTEQQMQAQMQQLQAQVANYQQLLAGLQAENQKLYAEKQGKVVDNEYALQMQRLKNDITVLVAEINTKAQDQAQRLEMFMEFWKEQHGSAHELAMAQTNAQNTQQLAAQQQAAQQAQQQQPTQTGGD
jgi:hypothetical protein